MSEMLERGVLLRIRRSNGDFWSSTPPSGDAWENILDAAFVDDEAIMLTAKTPAKLDMAINILLESLVKIFAILRLEINWKPGKTEAILQYRGRDATAKTQSRRKDGKLQITVPGCDVMINVVEKYTHLGGAIARTGSLQHDAAAKSSSAMGIYALIAFKVFASKRVTNELKVLFMQSLILTRLLFNAHALVPNPRYIRTLNAVYMRVVGRIVDMPLFDDSSVSDLEVRILAKMSSLDCWLVKARLRYLGRMLRNRPEPLLALLACRPKNKMLPWAELIVEDMRIARRMSTLCRNLGDPADEPMAWRDFILASQQRWSDVIGSIHFFESICDRHAKNADLVSVHVVQCSVCDETFDSVKTMELHTRVKHKMRSSVRYYVDKDAICQVCHSAFGSRLSCIAHLADRRPARDRCWKAILANPHGFEMLSTETCCELDEKDRSAKLLARRQGHSHVIATKQSMDCNGKPIGRTSA
jgi:hypothetical protein